MPRAYYGADLRTGCRTRLVVVLVHAGVAATVGIASAISGAAVALHLAAGPPPARYTALPAGAAAAIPAAASHGSMANAPAPTAAANIADAAGIVAAASATDAAPSVPSAASPPPTERELTFAWGYAQRHPDAPARQAEARVGPALASTPTRAAATGPKREARRGAEQRASIPQRQAIGGTPSMFFQGFADTPHQTLGYAEDRRANAVRAFSRGNASFDARHHGPSQFSANLNQTRS
jgi:hypothetical protein